MTSIKDLEKEAQENCICTDTYMRANYVTGYVAGAESREKQIAELEQQIKEIKRYLDCEYCEHYTQPAGCKNCNEEIRSDWKLKE